MSDAVAEAHMLGGADAVVFGVHCITGVWVCVRDGEVVCHV